MRFILIIFTLSLLLLSFPLFGQETDVLYQYEPWQTTEYDKNGEIIGKVVNGVQTIENSLQIIPKLEVDSAN